MNDRKLKNDFLCIKDSTFKEINEILKRYDYDWYIFFTYFIASIFGVDSADLLSKDKRPAVTYARWMLWYSIYTYCGKSFKEIAEICAVDGASFSAPAIMDGILRIKSMINTEPFFNEKWYVIKSIITNKKASMKKEPD